MAVGKRAHSHHIEVPTQRDRLPAVAQQQLTPSDEYPDRRDFAPAHLCDYFASRRRQDHLDREIAAVWRGDTAGGRGQGAGRPAAGALGLDGDRARARHLGLLGGDELRTRGPRLQPARHAGSPGFQRGYLSHPHRGRQRGNGARRRPQRYQGGIEEQTRKLFEVCRRRDVPIITFVDNLDREGRETPLETSTNSSRKDYTLELKCPRKIKC
jgi:hypothetical protein